MIAYFIFQLLGGLHSDREEEQDLVNPGNDALGLVAVEFRDTLVVDDVVNGEDQLPALEVEAQGQVARESRDQGFLRREKRNSF